MKTTESITQAPDLAGTHFVPGYDFVNNDSHPNDDCAHGTHVTGTIAQTTNNSLGVAGVAFNCSIMPIKVLDASGNGTYTAIVNGITFAADNGAEVINMSLGGASGSTALQNAVIYAYNRGCHDRLRRGQRRHFRPAVSGGLYAVHFRIGRPLRQDLYRLTPAMARPSTSVLPAEM